MQQNKFLEHADKQWAEDGIRTEKAILLLGGMLFGMIPSNEEIIEVRNGLLQTLMVDTPSGMFECAFHSMIEGRISAGAEIHAGDGGYQEVPIEQYVRNPAWDKILSTPTNE